ncbi:Rieske 2Fe-2S domain-containing protein [Georgenia sp. AZ-5]|uniref:Rieske 2Fe-2S domain-containing protein n=1 Tax=Georgenia sp. AZ-5 TaxID=3367526 RepID=UPI0037552DDD
MDPIEQKKLLMDVRPGSKMHELMKRFWLPLTLSRDVVADGDPMRVTALGKDFVVFRDTNGRVGLMDELCIHRSASLCLGRNEEGGLRCIYHGWKYAVDGSVMDMPNVRDERLKERVRQPSYSARDEGGIIWGYFGPKEEEPPLPHHAFFDVPEENRVVELMVASTNYTRVVEGLLDSSHTGILHQDSVRANEQGTGPKLAFGGTSRTQLGASISKNLAPAIEVQDTDFGMRYAAIRDYVTEAGEPQQVARVTAWAFPTTIVTPGDNLMQLTLPVDNDRSHFFMVFWDATQEIGVGEKRETIRQYYGIDDEGMDAWGLGREYHGLPGRPSKENNWGQDREAMRNGSFTGIHRFIPEDFAVSSSMGKVEDYPIEHLVPSDLAIARFRRRLVDNAQRLSRGDEIVGLEPKEPLKAAVITLEDGKSWKDHFAGLGVS